MMTNHRNMYKQNLYLLIDKMKIVKVVAFLCASVALAGCSGKGETYHCGDVERIDAFPHEYNLGETKPLDIDLTGAVNVFAADSLMVSEYLSAHSWMSSVISVCAA